MADAESALPNDTTALLCPCSRLMGSDAFRSLFTLYQSQTKVSSHIELISPSLMTDSEDVHGEGTYHASFPRLAAAEFGQVCCVQPGSGGHMSSLCSGVTWSLSVIANMHSCVMRATQLATLIAVCREFSDPLACSTSCNVCPVQDSPSGHTSGGELKLNLTPAAELSKASQALGLEAPMSDSPAYRSGVDINFLRHHDI